MILRKTLVIFLTLLFHQVSAFTAYPPVADTLLLPSTHHFSDTNSDDVMLLSCMLQYYYGPVEFHVYGDGFEEITDVRWLVDSSSDARMYGEVVQKPDSFSFGLNEYFELTRFPSGTVHTVTARVSVADGDSTDIVWRFIITTAEFNLFTATVKIVNAVDTLQGDSIFTLSFNDAAGLDTTIFSTEYDNCGTMARVGGFRFDAVDSIPPFTDTLQMNALSETYEYSRNNKYRYILPFLDNENSQLPCQVLYIGSAQKHFACIPVPFSSTVDEPPFSLEQAYQDYCAVSPLKLRIEPAVVREVLQGIITCPTIFTNQNTTRLLAWYDEEYWYFEENKGQFEVISNSSYSYTQQFEIDGSGEVTTVSCSERCYAPEGLTCIHNDYCPVASVSPGQTAARSGGNPYRVICSKSKGSIGIFYRPEEKPAGISIYSLAGRLYCHTTTIGRLSTIIRSSDYPAGLYVVAVNENRKCGLHEYRFVVLIAPH